MPLQLIFEALISKYNSDKQVHTSLWQQISNAYTGKQRHYHNLKHLEALVVQLEKCQSLINDWDIVLFSVFYHDIVYKATKKDNEPCSANEAVKALSLLGISKERITNCEKQILATASHSFSTDFDTNLFTDADLSILGSESQTYQTYCEQIRQEYSIYPDFMYKPGRKKVIEHFLAMERIFKTDYFYELYEKQAIENLKMELGSF